MIQQEVLAIQRARAVNKSTPEYVRQTLIQLKTEMEKFVIISADFSTPLIVINSTADITLTRL